MVVIQFYYKKSVEGNMRIKLTLGTEKPLAIPINYQYQLSAAVYHLLQNADHEYAEQLHERGYELGSKKFKLFTFSTLYPDFYKLKGKQMVIAPGRTVLYVGSLKNEFLMNFVEGIFINEILRIGQAEFTIQQVEVVPKPIFADTMKFRCLSPIVATTKEEVGGILKQRDCQLGEERYTENIIKNTYNKYEIIYGEKVPNKNLQINFQPEDIEKYKRGKLIQFKNTYIKGFLCPFEARGSKELLEIMWEIGAGEKNSGGFGMVDVR